MIKDTYELNGFSNAKFPKLKGHLKITLKNVHNGKTEVVEGDNIVTNAVRDILSANYLGAVDYAKLFGADGLWKKWYGGVLCYQNPHPTITVDNEEVLDPDNYYPQAESVNHLTAHAGQSAVDPAHDDDLRRGNPTSAAYILADNSVTQVWEWGTTHGNGTISALSLTHSDTGDVGLGSTSYAFSQFTPLEVIDNRGTQFLTNYKRGQILAQYDEAHALTFAIGNAGEWGFNNQAFETNKITVSILKAPFSKAGLYQRQFADTNFSERFTVQISFNVYANPCFYFDQTNKRLWVFTNFTSASTYSQTVIKYSIIDCVSKTEVTHGTITSDTANIAPLGYGDNTNYYSNGRSVFAGIVFDDTYFYFPTGIRTGEGDYKERLTGYQKINFNNQADQSTISLVSGEVDAFNSPLYCGGLLVGTEYVANGNSMYKCQNVLGNRPYAGGFTFAFAQPNNPSSFGNRFDNLGLDSVDAYSWSYKYILANKMLNTTLFNLPTPITKSASQAMTVEYTLTEVSS